MNNVSAKDPNMLELPKCMCYFRASGFKCAIMAWLFASVSVSVCMCVCASVCVWWKQTINYFVWSSMSHFFFSFSPHLLSSWAHSSDTNPFPYSLLFGRPFNSAFDLVQELCCACVCVLLCVLVFCVISSLWQGNPFWLNYQTNVCSDACIWLWRLDVPFCAVA